MTPSGQKPHGLATRLFAIAAGVGLTLLTVRCLPDPPKVEPEPKPVAKPAPITAPNVALSMPTNAAKSPVAQPTDGKLDASRAVLMGIVDGHTRDPDNPWAIGHGLLVLGPDMKVEGDRAAVPWLFETYAQWTEVGGEDLVVFPREVGPIRVEPHADLMLKVFTEIGVPLDARFVVQGKPATVEQLYRHSMHRAWIRDGRSGFTSMNDTPWALQALATAAPEGASWTAPDGKTMTLDLLTDAVVADLHQQTTFMREAMQKGEKVQKRRQGIFGYTCGGQHLLQGAAYAVARGFGSDQSRDWVEEEVDILFWRLNVELEIYDYMIETNPSFEGLLLEQRLKFLGHFLESSHKLAALEIFAPDEAQTEKMARARSELITTVERLQENGILEKLDLMRQSKDRTQYQTYLDFVGDSAHAIRGIDLSTGEGVIRY